MSRRNTEMRGFQRPMRTEAVMTEQSSMHWYLNWAKQRIDETDATLASFEAQAAKAKADSKAQADELIAELNKQRDQFQANANTQAQPAKRR